MLFKTKYNDYFKENFEVFDALDFIAKVTAHIPPRGKQYIRRYGLYSSRTRGKWPEMKHVVRLAPAGWREKRLDSSDIEEVPPEIIECSVSEKQRKSAWARLIKKVYGVDPLICPKCQSEMRVMSVITDRTEVIRILRHLFKIGRAHPGVLCYKGGSFLVRLGLFYWFW